MGKYRRKHRCYWCNKRFEYVPYSWTDVVTDVTYDMCSYDCRRRVADHMSPSPEPWSEGLRFAMIATLAIGLIAGLIVYFGPKLFN